MQAVNGRLISLCACTYHRPFQLKRLLESLAAQQLEPGWQVELIVVDNDVNASARASVEAARTKSSNMLLEYAVEPVQGISYARNRAVALARGELIAFLDDDEYVVAHWLKDMVATLDDSPAAAVLGPVVPEFPRGSKSWAINSGLFDRPQFATGAGLNSNECRTGNVLFRGRWLRRYLPQPFDVRLSQSGSEDTDYFIRAARDGATFVWCHTAIAVEEVPLSRQSVTWVLGRRFRAAAAYWRLQGTTLSAARRCGLVMVGLAGAAFCGVAALVQLPFGMHKSVRWLVKSASGLGRIAMILHFRILVYTPRTQ